MDYHSSGYCHECCRYDRPVAVVSEWLTDADGDDMEVAFGICVECLKAALQKLETL